MTIGTFERSRSWPCFRDLRPAISQITAVAVFILRHNISEISIFRDILQEAFLILEMVDILELYYVIS